MIRIVVADDEALVRGGFRMILDAQPDMTVAAEAADGKEAIRLVWEHRPDVVLMDIRMPGMDGLAATRRLLDSHETPPRVLILTTFDLDDYVYEAMRAGASGFLLKTAPPDELTQAIRTVANGDVIVSPAITRRLIREFVSKRQHADSAALIQRLTDREQEVLRLVARGLSNAEIAESLFLSTATVKTHVNHLLAKLGARDRVQAVVLAYEAGFASPIGD